MKWYNKYFQHEKHIMMIDSQNVTLLAKGRTLSEQWRKQYDQCEYLLIPVNTTDDITPCEHWFLMVYIKAQKRMNVYDSMESYIPHHKQYRKDIMDAFKKHGLIDNDTKMLVYKAFPQQTERGACGYRMLSWIYMIHKYPSTFANKLTEYEQYMSQIFNKQSELYFTFTSMKPPLGNLLRYDCICCRSESVNCSPDFNVYRIDFKLLLPLLLSF